MKSINFAFLSGPSLAHSKIHCNRWPHIELLHAIICYHLCPADLAKKYLSWHCYPTKHLPIIVCLDMRFARFARGSKADAMHQLKHCLPSGLLCLSTAKEGGLTSWSSSGSIYNRLLESHPDYVKVCIVKFLNSNSRKQIAS